MTVVPVIAGREHLAYVPHVEVQGGRRLPAYDRPERVEAIAAELERRGGYAFESPVEHGSDPIHAVHDPGMLAFLQRASAAAGEGPYGVLIADTFMHESLRSGLAGTPEVGLQGASGKYTFDTITAIGPATYTAACEAVDCALTAADRLDGGSALAFALTRPAGHHAARKLFGGGTFLNNAAITARFLRGRGRERIALIDLDIHHGNGAQSLFYEHADVFVANVHVDPAENFPFFVGFEDERGGGDGKGRNLNVVLGPNAGIEEYLRVLDRALEALADFAADALVVSLGVDGHERDPNQAAALRTEDFRRIGDRVGGLGLPTTVVLEGGYAEDSVGASIANWLEGFAASHTVRPQRGGNPATAADRAGRGG